MEFIHLHVHSQYSLLDGSIRFSDLVAKARALNMPAVALTDHGNLFGAVDFFTEAKESGIKPILGIEAYISPTTRQDRSMGNQTDAAYHLILLAQDTAGWHNLIRLSSQSYLEGFYYKPRIDRELLAQHNAGLIGFSACLKGEIPAALLRQDLQTARRIAGEYRDIFGPERFFIEIMNQGEPEQDQVNPLLAQLARDLNLKLVGTNDVHFLNPEDKRVHEVLTCISTGKTLGAADALHYSPELFFKSSEEMGQTLAAWPEAIANTQLIGEMCRPDLNFGVKHLPRFRTPHNETPDAYLCQLAWQGLKARFPNGEIPQQYRARLEWELQVIQQKGYSSYFLIVADFVDFAHRNKIPAGARGSGVATLLGYALGIANVDPIRYGLLFERFTDPQRKEDPDIDIDMCQEGRAHVIQYVREKYGHVAQIITFGTLKARAAIRDVGRVMDIPLPEVDTIAKKVPDDVKMTLVKALTEEPELRQLAESNSHIKELIEHSMKLEGLARHSGVHAAGVVVCDEPLANFVPLCTQKDAEIITQWDGPTCEKAGLMKMDFLGLRTLTIIQRACELVRVHTGRDLDPESLPLDDQRVFALFRKGETDGVFQFESEGMKGVLVQMQPNRIEELIAANAMYRPGPMKLIAEYCDRKRGATRVPPIHPLVDDLLAETYGIMIYQEQVMQVLNLLGKLPLNSALTLIKAISKKKGDVIAAEWSNFMRGAKENGIQAEQAEELFALIKEFAGYGFNKAHSTRYAIVAYQTAYFKVYYPREFFAATLTFESGDRDKVVQYMREAARQGVRISPPDINTSAHDFTVDGEQVRFGLAAVKGIGSSAVEAIIRAREETGRFRDLFDFCQRVDLRAVNRAAVEALIKCGAFDRAGGSHRGAMLAAVDKAVQTAQFAARERQTGQMNFFGVQATDTAAARPQFPDVPAWSQEQLLASEKETLGFYVTAHPLAKYAVELEDLNQPRGLTLAQAAQSKQDQRVGVGGMITHVRPMLMKKGAAQGRKMAVFVIEDLHGKIDGVMFAEAFEKYGDVLKTDALVFLSGVIERSRERPSLRADEALPLNEAVERLTAALRLALPKPALAETVVGQVKDILGKYRGNTPVKIECQSQEEGNGRVVIEVDHQLRVKPSHSFICELVALLGKGMVHLEPKPLRANHETRYPRGPR